MKKFLAIMLTFGLVLSLGAATALAADTPPYNGNITGTITSDNDGNIAGSLEGAYDLTIVGHFDSLFVDQKATFIGTVSGDIEGTVTGTVCVNGLDSLYGVITGTGADETVRIAGAFVQSGTPGDFEGKIITGTAPAPVTSLDIQGNEATVAAGSSLQLTAVTTPTGPYDVLWSVWVDQSDLAWIGQDGVLHALKAGTVSVIANTLDSSLATKTETVTILDPETEVTAAIDPTYTIVIPAAVDFGTLQKDTGVKTQPFQVEAKDVIVENGRSIEIEVDSNFLMTGPASLAYALYKSGTTLIEDGDPFTTFTGNGIEAGTVKVDTAAISKAGNYSGIMTFTISYQ